MLPSPPSRHGGAASGRRLILAETDGTQPHVDFAFQPGDIVMVGRELAGVAAEVYAAADAVVHVPMRAGLRSLNVAVAAAMVLGEALRQVGGYPDARTSRARGTPLQFGRGAGVRDRTI